MLSRILYTLSIITDCAFCLFFVILIASLRDENLKNFSLKYGYFGIFNLNLSNLRLISEL